MARNLDVLIEPRWFVSVIDDALSLDSKAREVYAETRDTSLVREREGMRAMRFWLRPLELPEKAACKAVGSIATMYSIAFRRACQRIDYFDGGEETFAPKETDKDQFGNERALWDDRELAEIGIVCGDMVEEMGLLVMRRAELTGKALRRGSIKWPRPQWLWPEVEAISSQLAAESRAT